ncbi:hypothetical protein Tco_1307959, partial [Tanacetum coccineum]
MVQNVPLVLNVCEPGIWLDKTEPSVIPIWVCVYNIPMELCNGNGIGNLNRNRIESVEDLEGKRFSGQHVGAQFVKHFQSVLGEAKLVDPISDPCSLFVKRLSLEDAEFMVRPVSKDEIKSVFFAINDEKAPGPDGLSQNFLKLL